MLGSPALPRMRNRSRRWTSPGELSFRRWPLNQGVCAPSVVPCASPEVLCRGYGWTAPFPLGPEQRSVLPFICTCSGSRGLAPALRRQRSGSTPEGIPRLCPEVDLTPRQHRTSTRCSRLRSPPEADRLSGQNSAQHRHDLVEPTTDTRFGLSRPTRMRHSITSGVRRRLWSLWVYRLWFSLSLLGAGRGVRSPMRQEPKFSSTTARRGWRWAGPVASRPWTRRHRDRDRPR